VLTLEAGLAIGRDPTVLASWISELPSSEREELREHVDQLKEYALRRYARGLDLQTTEDIPRDLCLLREDLRRSIPGMGTVHDIDAALFLPLGEAVKALREVGPIERRDKAEEVQRRNEASPTDDGAGVGLTKIWYHGEQSYSVDGITPINVSNKEMHTMLQAFLDRAIAIQTKDLHGINNVAATAEKIIDRFGPNTVRRPGKDKGIGYYVCVCSLKTTK
jgi:hypothetical protein